MKLSLKDRHTQIMIILAVVLIAVYFFYGGSESVTADVTEDDSQAEISFAVEEPSNEISDTNEIGEIEDGSTQS